MIKPIKEDQFFWKTRIFLEKHKSVERIGSYHNNADLEQAEESDCFVLTLE